MKDNQIALYIDAENVSAKYIEKIMEELAQFGQLRVRKVYANWEKKEGNVQTWNNTLLINHSLRKVQQDSYASKNNASDILITIDIMKFLCRNEATSNKITLVALVTSDSDFTPLVDELISQGIDVIGFGENKKNSKDALRNACTQYFELGVEKSKKTLYDDDELITLLRMSIYNTANEDGYAYLAQIGKYLKQKSSEVASNYGSYKSWSEIFKSLPKFFEVDYRGEGNNKAMIVRVK